MYEYEILPSWVWKMVAKLEEFEQTHDQLYVKVNTAGVPLGFEKTHCGAGSALAGVPSEVRHTARTMLGVFGTPHSWPKEAVQVTLGEEEDDGH